MSSRAKKALCCGIVTTVLFLLFSFSAFASVEPQTEILSPVTQLTQLYIIQADGTTIRNNVEFDTIESGFQFYYGNLLQSATVNGVGFEIFADFQATSADLLETGNYQLTFDYLSPVIPNEGYTDLVRGYVEVFGIRQSDNSTFTVNLGAYTTTKYLGAFTDSLGLMYGHYRVSCNVMGSDIWQALVRETGSTNFTAEINSIRVEDFNFGTLPRTLVFAISNDFIFQSVSVGDSALAAQQEANEMLDSLLNYQLENKPDTSEVNSQVNDITGMEESLTGSVDKENLDVSIDKAENALDDIGTNFGTAIGFVSSCFESVVNLNGIFNIIIVVLILEVIGVFLNHYFVGVGRGSNSKSNTSKSSKKKQGGKT